MKQRYPLLDSLRGAALLIMFAYHFAFDLSLFGAAKLDFRSPFWLAYRFLILTLFLGLSGAGIAISGRRFPDMLRLLRLASAAGLISLATWLLFPHDWVYFGILHFLVVASVATAPLSRSPALSFAAGAFLLGAWFELRGPAFDGALLSLTGLGVALPRTLDFVPLLPWLSLVLFGIFAGAILPSPPPPWLGRGNRDLALLGRHSLLLYVSHQGVLLPFAWLVSRLRA